METLLQIFLSETFAFSILRVTTPILFAALAALISKKAGVNNISLEGTMLFASLAGVLVSAFTQSALWGLVGAILVGVLFAGVLAFCALRLRADIFLSGIALNSFASGSTVFLLYVFTGEKGVSASLKSMVIPSIDIPLIKDIPVLGSIFSGHNVLTYVALLCVPLMYILLHKTALGLRIRAVGEYPSAIDSVGLGVGRIQLIALLISGALCGLGGAFMSMGYVSWFSRNMTAGRGFIAIAAEAMGRGSPGGTLVASLVFGVADALANSLQVFNISAELIRMIPYLTTIVGITLYARNIKRQKLGKGAAKRRLRAGKQDAA